MAFVVFMAGLRAASAFLTFFIAFMALKVMSRKYKWLTVPMVRAMEASGS